MRITHVRHFLVHPGRGKNLCFVRVDTDEGVHGWGECYTQSDRDTSGHRAHRSDQALPDRSRSGSHQGIHADDLRRLRRAARIDGPLLRRERARAGALGHQGQGQPGCPCTHCWAVRVTIPHPRLCKRLVRWCAQTPDELGTQAAAIVERGFSALKFDPVPGPWRTFVDKDIERSGHRERPGGSRRRGNADVDIFDRDAPAPGTRARGTDCPPPSNAPRRSGSRNRCWRRTCPPWPGPNATSTFPSSPARRFTPSSNSARSSRRGAADIINPDVCNVGGILEVEGNRGHGRAVFRRRVTAQLQQHHRGIGRDDASVRRPMPNFLITEYFVNFEAFGREIAREPWRRRRRLRRSAAGAGTRHRPR